MNKRHRSTTSDKSGVSEFLDLDGMIQNIIKKVDIMQEKINSSVRKL
jgi:hypothetical protein